MLFLYSSNYDDVELTEPQMTRWRFRYRGVRESYKSNISADQALFDIAFLYGEISTQDSELDDNLDTIENGGSVDADFVWDDATPTLEPIELDGIADLASRLDKLRQRIKYLEML
jgi:hypothetical protein